MSAGYSGTPLVRKLGIKVGYQVVLLYTPDNYLTTLGDLPDDVNLLNELPEKAESVEFIQAFYQERVDLEAEFDQLKQAIRKDGMVWISWLKKASKIPTDINENVVREIGLGHGLVDVKVAAVDNIWSGLKFVYRVEDR